MEIKKLEFQELVATLSNKKGGDDFDSKIKRNI